MRKFYSSFAIYLLSFLVGVTGLAQTTSEIPTVTITPPARGPKTEVKEIPLSAKAKPLTSFAPSVTMGSTAAAATSCPKDITVDNDAGRRGAEVNYTVPAYLQRNLTQSGSNAINSTLGSKNCDNRAFRLLRAYNLPALGITNGFTVNSVDFAATDNTPVTVNVYQWNPATTLAYANFTLKGSTAVTAVNALDLRNHPVSATIDAGYALIVEVAGNSGLFRLGYNTTPQTAPTYFSFDCNLAITDVATQHPEVAIVLNANGYSGSSPTQIAGLSSGSEFPVGTITNTFRYSDGATCSFKVTVTDSEKPKLTCPIIPRQCYQSDGNYIIAPLQASDNCGIANANISYTVSGATERKGTGKDASGDFNPGTSTIKWTVTDDGGNSQTCETTITVADPLTASIPDVKALSKGVAVNTVYRGYEPASCLTLSAQASGGTGSYEYEWSTGATASSIQVCPTATTTYSVTVTDEQGCSTTTEKEIIVIDVQCGNKNDKVTVCHKGDDRKTLCISKQDVADHLAHGDYLGGCNGNNAAYTVASQELGVAEESRPGKLTLEVRGNPAPDYFTLVPSSNSTQPLAFRVMDASGKIMESRENMPVQGAIELGHRYRSGMYFVEVRQGQQRVTLKLLKSPY